MLRSFKDEKQIDNKRRNFLVVSAKLLGAFGVFWSCLPLLSSLNPSRKILRDNSPLRVDLSGLRPSEKLMVKWRGKPICILHRTAAQIRALKEFNPTLRDPNSLVDQQPKYAQNAYRSRNPKFLVLVNICTHLGCSPQLTQGVKRDGFYCPCHGSRFDLAGRVHKNMPAPINLEVPPYYFLDEHTLVIGESHV